MKHYLAITGELAMIDIIAMKGRIIITGFLLQKQVLKQLHSNHMGFEKMRLLVVESVY